MRIVLLGPPGAGKGTQAELICKYFAIPKIGTGDMLRSAIAQNTKIGQSVKNLVEQGGLVPEEVIIDLIKERIQYPDCERGFLFDGFPRTIHQAETMEKLGLSVDAVIAIFVSDEEIIHRMSGRRVHLNSGRVYHVKFNPPKVVDKDDITGEPLVQRDDDKEETVRNRLQIYHQQTEPLIGWFKQRPDHYHYYAILGNGSVEYVYREIMDQLKSADMQRSGSG